ncbi:hypothetical protein GCM10023148_26490 [Actinokineospora soli]
MPSDPGGPALEPTLVEWLRARDDTTRHLASPTPEGAWTQRLADLLTTERSWQDQYTELLALDTHNGRFPPSNR